MTAMLAETPFLFLSSSRLIQAFCLAPLAPSSEELPSIDQWQCATSLDRSLRHVRSLHLQQIVAAAQALKYGDATELSTVLEQAEDWAGRLRTIAEEVSRPRCSNRVFLVTVEIIINPFGQNKRERMLSLSLCSPVRSRCLSPSLRTASRTS